MTPWAWLKFTIFLWLLRKTLKLTGWLLLAAVVIAAWPVTVVAARRVRRGVAARLAPGPAVPDRRVGAGGERSVAGRGGGPHPGLAPGAPGARPGLGARLGPPGRAGPGPGVPAAGPGGAGGRAGAGRGAVGVADLRHHHRAGRHHRLGPDHLRRPPVEPAGPHRPGPDQSPRRRPAARPRREHPGRRHHPRHRPQMAARCSPSRPRRAPGTWSSSAPPGQREDEPDDPAVGGLVHRHPAGVPGRAGGPAAAGRAGLQGRPRRPPQSRPHPPPAVRRRAPAGSRSGRTRPGCACGTCPRTSWPCCCTR